VHVLLNLSLDAGETENSKIQETTHRFELLSFDGLPMLTFFFFFNDLYLVMCFEYL
jgi:hypothetical protein